MKNKILFCIIDDIDSYANEEIKTTIRNILDFTISNLHIKGYDVIVDKDENSLLQNATNYDYAVVMSPGTEFLNGFAFFEELNKLINKDFFVAGHILDRSKYDAYYELHHQCYVVNMASYNALQSPTVGYLQKDVQHTQVSPKRSKSNIHDDYTPIKLEKGVKYVKYKHKCHGWNLLRVAFENNLRVIVFGKDIRNNKRHYYPESEKDFYKHLHFIKEKLDFCKDEFVHTDNTEWSTGITEKYQQIVIPASGTLYLDLIEEGTVILFDYNQRALDYWEEKLTKKEKIKYKFINTNLLNETNLVDYLDPNLKTLINLSNIFCYEGTVAQYSLRHRLTAQNNLVESLEDKIKDITINFTMKANSGH